MQLLICPHLKKLRFSFVPEAVENGDCVNGDSEAGVAEGDEGRVESAGERLEGLGGHSYMTSTLHWVGSPKGRQEEGTQSAFSQWGWGPKKIVEVTYKYRPSSGERPR